MIRPRAGARVRILQKAKKPENRKPTDKAKRQSQTEQRQNKEPGDMTT